MFERLRSARDSGRALMAASGVIRQLFNGREATGEQKAQEALAETRRKAMENPEFSTLSANFEYQRWLRNEEKVNDNNSLDAYLALATFAPYNSFDDFNAYMKGVIDPGLGKSELHQKSVEYCTNRGLKFVHTASEIADKFASGKAPIDESSMKHAMQLLVDNDNPDYGKSLLWDSRNWGASKYNLLHEELGVTLEDMRGVNKEQIMAGVTLFMGLWVRLADIGAKRPVSGYDFGPPLKHCSFVSLAQDTGWVEYNKNRKLFSEAFQEFLLGTETRKQDELFASFRGPQFFEHILGILKSGKATSEQLSNEYTTVHNLNPNLY